MISDFDSDDMDDGELEEAKGQRPWDKPNESEPEEEARPAEDISKLSQYKRDHLTTIADTMALLAAAVLNVPPVLKPAKHVTNTTKYDTPPGTCCCSAQLMWNNSNTGTTVYGDLATNGKEGSDLKGKTMDRGGEGRGGSVSEISCMLDVARVEDMDMDNITSPNDVTNPQDMNSSQNMNGVTSMQDLTWM